MTTDGAKTSLRRRTVLAAVAAAMGLAAVGSSEAAGPALVDVEVIDRETGQAAHVWRHRGRLFVAGRPGALYSLRVTNNTPGRVLAVMSVDGVNILTGQTAGYNQRGYVFGPYETYDVSGWRKSDSQIAAFTFAPLSRSYAARTGRPNDVGVIGVAVFEERVYYAPPVAAVSPAIPRSYESADQVEGLVVQRAPGRPTTNSRPRWRYTCAAWPVSRSTTWTSTSSGPAASLLPTAANPIAAATAASTVRRLRDVFAPAVVMHASIDLT